MGRNWWMKFLLLVSFIIGAAIMVFPTVKGLNLETTKFPYKKKVNLGLDLQGGLYMVFGIEYPKVFRDLLLRQGDSLKENLASEHSLHVKSADLQPAASNQDEDPRFRLTFETGAHEKIVSVIKSRYPTLRITEQNDRLIEVGISREYRSELKDQTLNQSIQVIRNRIDEFGVAEPSIVSQGSDRIVVELPGVSDVERAKALVGRTAKLEFKIAADKEMGPSQLIELISKLESENHLAYKEGESFQNYVGKLNELARGKIPAGTEIAFERIEAGSAKSARKDRPEGASSEMRVPYLLYSKTEVSGEQLQDAQVNFDPQDNRPIVSFELNPQGASLFEKVTTAHLRERLAIVLDGIVHSAPTIQSPIPGGRGQITLGQAMGDAAVKEAKDLAIVLRAGALPARLDLLEQRVIGPSLGQDSIRQGALSGIVGCVAIFLFILFYYRGSGAVAVVSLLLNGLFSFAILIGMDATLTLPGIAGIALTIGMAVDSNVIIFERIRDELEEGKSPVAALQSGFEKAWSSIFDANITHGIVATILFYFGTGPIRGFAITLLIGIVTTLFCAVTVCKFVFDTVVIMKKGELKGLSI